MYISIFISLYLHKFNIFSIFLYLVYFHICICLSIFVTPTISCRSWHEILVMTGELKHSSAKQAGAMTGVMMKVYCRLVSACLILLLALPLTHAKCSPSACQGHVVQLADLMRHMRCYADGLVQLAERKVQKAAGQI